MTQEQFYEGFKPDMLVYVNKEFHKLAAVHFDCGIIEYFIDQVATRCVYLEDCEVLEWVSGKSQYWLKFRGQDLNMLVITQVVDEKLCVAYLMKNKKTINRHFLGECDLEEAKEQAEKLFLDYLNKENNA